MEAPEQETDISPRILDLRRQIESGNRTALDAFWQEMTTKGTPLIESIDSDDQYVLVTFLWRAKEPIRNVVLVGQLVGQDPKQNQMDHLSDTDLWYRSYRFRRDLPALYHLSPNDLLTPYDGPSENWALRPTWQGDPLNPDRFNPEPDDDIPEKALMSVLTLPGAPPQSWIVPHGGIPEGKIHDHNSRSRILANDRHIQVYVPPDYSASGNPYPLIIFLDAFYYLDFRQKIIEKL